MSLSYTQSNTTTFTLTHAKRLASKVATDLKRIQRFYGEPGEDRINRYKEEITSLLKNGYVSRITYGFQKDDKWIEPTLEYTDEDLLGRSADDDLPGLVKPGRDIKGASFGSYLEYSQSWYDLSQSERDEIKKSLPVSRSTSDKPGVNGFFENDRTYSAGGRALNRRRVRS